MLELYDKIIIFIKEIVIKKRDDRCLIEVLNTCVLRKIIYLADFFNFPTTCIKLEKLCKNLI